LKGEEGMKRIMIILVGFLLIGAVEVQAGLLGDLMKGVTAPSSKGTDVQTTAAGLKEALSVGTGNAVGLLSQTDGYFANKLVKILLPKQIQKMADFVGKIGYQPQVDEFTLSMNRAAEAAAPKAKGIFLDAIKQMTFEDAIKILKGDQTAATEYLKSKTYGSLAESFKPIITKTMATYDVTRRYDALVGTYKQNLPFMSLDAVDLDRYVTTRALDGLFFMIGEEEKKIRTNPAARVTDLLKTVFGK
jgi:hypothetical protein